MIVPFSKLAASQNIECHDGHPKILEVSFIFCYYLNIENKRTLEKL
jgi:hypothetical protein